MRIRINFLTTFRGKCPFYIYRISTCFHFNAPHIKEHQTKGHDASSKLRMKGKHDILTHPLLFFIILFYSCKNLYSQATQFIRQRLLSYIYPFLFFYYYYYYFSIRKKGYIVLNEIHQIISMFAREREIFNFSLIPHFFTRLLESVENFLWNWLCYRLTRTDKRDTR